MGPLGVAAVRLLGALEADPGSAARVVTDAFRESGARPWGFKYGRLPQSTTMRAHVDIGSGSMAVGVTGGLQTPPDFRFAAEEIIRRVGHAQDLSTILILYDEGPGEDEITLDFQPGDVRFMPVRSFLQRLQANDLREVIERARESPPSYETTGGRVDAFDAVAGVGLIKPLKATERVLFTSDQLVGAVPGQQVQFLYTTPTPEAGLPEAAGVEAAASKTTQSKQVGAWITEPAGLVLPPGSGLTIGRPYRLKIKVGDPEPATLLDDPEVVIPASDIPPEGLDTDWTVTSDALELMPSGAITSVASEAGLRGSAVGFPLHIPAEGDSETVSIPFAPFAAGRATIYMRAFVGKRRYRSLTAEVTLGSRTAPFAPLLRSDFVTVRADRIDLTTRSGEEQLSLDVLRSGSEVLVDADLIGFRDKQVMKWPSDTARLAALIADVRKAAETLRGTHDAYLNAIDPEDLHEQLNAHTAVADPTDLPDTADADHIAAWERVRESPELRALVAKGYALYNAVFPLNSSLRTLVERLRPGGVLDIDWSGSARVPDVPWTLMYRYPANQPVDPLGFLGMRYRICYRAYEATSGPDTLLGDSHDADTACALFWGTAEADTAEEARRQHDTLSQPRRIFIPDGAEMEAPKLSLLKLLDAERNDALAVLYMFCHYGHVPSEEPKFRFGDTNDPPDVLSLVELQELSPRPVPLVFANACATGALTAFETHPFKAHFFDNGTAAYLGTETMVPICFASRFATAFLQLFERGTADARLSAGEALTQARLLIWGRYRNLGGLLYGLTNQYDLLRTSKVKTL